MKFFKSKKEKKENKVYLTIIFLLFSISILIFIIKAITNIFTPEEKYDIENVTQYIQVNDGTIDKTKIVKDYSSFYTVQGILEQFVGYLIAGRYKDTYKVLDSEMKNVYTNEENYVETIAKFTNDNFVVKDPNVEYANKNRLKKLYRISDKEFLAEYLTVNGNTKKIGVRLYKDEKKYRIFYIEM